MLQVAFAGEANLGADGSGMAGNEEGGPWSSLTEYTSDLGVKWATSPNHNARQVPLTDVCLPV